MRLNFSLLAALFLIAWGPSLLGVFHFDDHSLFVDPAVSAASGWLDVWRPLQTRPLTQFTFWLSGQMGGKSAPLAYHLWNFALHGFNVWMAWRILQKLRVEPLWFAVAVFALHPFQTEPVNYVFARSTLLMAAFCLSTLWLWLDGRTWPAVGCFALALLAKEECVTFPLVLLALDFSRRRAAGIRWAPGATMLLLSLAAGLRAMAATAAIAGANSGFASPVRAVDYFQAQGFVILCRYLRMFAVPYGFTVDPEIGLPGWALGSMCWLVLLAAAWFAWKRFENPWLAIALVLFIPSSSVFPAEDLAADRRMYLPVLALVIGALAIGLAKYVPARAQVAIALVLAALSCYRSAAVWRTENALWQEACERAPGKVRPRIHLARVSAPEDAVKLLDEAARIAPQNADVPNELGLLQLRAGNPAAALAAFGRALALDPSNAMMVNNRGVALYQLGQVDAARQDFERALRMDPAQPDARRNLRQMSR